MRGRRPIPTGLKRIRGNPGKRPLQPDLQLKGSQLPEAPSFLSVEAEIEWKRVLQVLAPTGILTALDTMPLAVYCETYSTWKLATERLAESDLTIVGANGHQVQNPLNRIASRAAADLVRYAAEFGLTPSSRSRVTGVANASAAEGSDEFFD